MIEAPRVPDQTALRKRSTRRVDGKSTESRRGSLEGREGDRGTAGAGSNRKVPAELQAKNGKVGTTLNIGGPIVSYGTEVMNPCVTNHRSANENAPSSTGQPPLRILCPWTTFERFAPLGIR